MMAFRVPKQKTCPRKRGTWLPFGDANRRDRDDSGGPIDATGELPGARRFGSPGELKRIIAGRTGAFCHNLTGKLLAYALCRQLDGYDEVVVDQLSSTIARDDYHMQTLVVGVVTSYPFTHRRVMNHVEAGKGK